MSAAWSCRQRYLNPSEKPRNLQRVVQLLDFTAEVPTQLSCNNRLPPGERGGVESRGAQNFPQSGTSPLHFLFTHTLTSMHAHKHIHMHTKTCAHTLACTRAHVHARTHTHTFTHTYSLTPRHHISPSPSEGSPCRKSTGRKPLLERESCSSAKPSQQTCEIRVWLVQATL